MGAASKELETLKRIQKDLFRHFTYVTDRQQHKTIEFWKGLDAIQSEIKRGDLKGDCEESAMAAVSLARQAGFDARLVICRDENGEGHCIAEIATHHRQEAYYIDNRHEVLAVRDDLSHYQFYAVGPWNPVPGDTRPWYRVID